MKVEESKGPDLAEFRAKIWISWIGWNIDIPTGMFQVNSNLNEAIWILDLQSGLAMSGPEGI